MGKLLIVLAGLVFSLDPFRTLANQLDISRLPFLEIDAGAFNLDRAPADFMQERGMSTESKPVLSKSGQLSINFAPNIAGRTNSDVPNGESDPVGILNGLQRVDEA